MGQLTKRVLDRVCATCKRRYGMHYGGEDEQAACPGGTRGYFRQDGRKHRDAFDLEYLATPHRENAYSGLTLNKLLLLETRP